MQVPVGGSWVPTIGIGDGIILGSPGLLAAACHVGT